MIKEENLLFIISQPRSGSSLLQQLLISTKKVKSVPEPWFMLSLIETYRKTSNQSGYNPLYAHINFMEYLERHTGSKNDFVGQIKKIALELYKLNGLNEKEIYFLDKTPRYYHILEELKELLPLAKFIILIRNPISVFASILDYNCQGDINEVLKQDKYHDLFTAPKKIVSILRGWDKENYHVVHYEDLVKDSVPTLNRLKSYLHIEPSQLEASYKVDNEFLHSRGIDKKSLAAHNWISNEFTDGWKKSIDNYQKKQLLLDYIQELGSQTVSSLGYDYKKLINQISAHEVKSKLSVKYNYLLYGAQKVSTVDFIKSRINEKLNNLLKL